VVLEEALDVTDDSGFLAIIDPDAYEGFVDEDWELDDLIAHFVSQMAQQRLLIWGTGRADIWSCVLRARAECTGFRQIEGSIASTQGRLHLTNYESLTMAAQFRQVTLPQKHELDQLVSIPPGEYTCRVTQLLDPDDDEAEHEDGDFIIELSTPGSSQTWTEIPWWER